MDPYISPGLIAHITEWIEFENLLNNLQLKKWTTQIAVSVTVYDYAHCL